MLCCGVVGWCNAFGTLRRRHWTAHRKNGTPRNKRGSSWCPACVLQLTRFSDPALWLDVAHIQYDDQQHTEHYPVNHRAEYPWITEVVWRVAYQLHTNIRVSLYTPWNTLADCVPSHNKVHIVQRQYTMIYVNDWSNFLYRFTIILSSCAMVSWTTPNVWIYDLQIHNNITKMEISWMMKYIYTYTVCVYSWLWSMHRIIASIYSNHPEQP